MHQETELIKSFNDYHTLIPPASLIVGSVQESTDYAIRYIQNIVCTYGGCKTCTACHSIAQQNHYLLLWITPEQRYTLETIETITSTINLSLEDKTHFFFVLSQADTLSPACANSLLKMVEEPPTGYHFIFLAQRLEEILPTIKSRCLITQLDRTGSGLENNPLLPFFTLTSIDNPLIFLKTLEQSKITEQECIQLLDALFVYWSALYKKSTGSHKQLLAYAVLELLKQHAQTPPMAGSTKLFLKNLYLSMHYVIHKKVL